MNPRTDSNLNLLTDKQRKTFFHSKRTTRFPNVLIKIKRRGDFNKELF